MSVIDASFTPGTEELFSEGVYRYKVLAGGRGCIHGDSLLDTPSGRVPIKDFLGGPVLSLTPAGIQGVWAGRPLVYPPEMLYRVTLDDGRSIDATANHRFLAEAGWATLSSLSSGCSLLQPLESAASLQERCCAASPSKWREDVLHWTRKVAGFLYCYLMDYRQYDESPAQAEESYCDAFRRLADVMQRMSRILTREDGPGSGRTDESRIFLSRLSTEGVLLAEEARNYGAAGSCSGGIAFELLSGLALVPQLFHARTNPAGLIRELQELVLGSHIESGLDETLQIVRDTLLLGVGDSSLSDALPTHCNVARRYKQAKITSIAPVGEAEFYDLFVPFYNNYLSAGMIHHNSSKSWAAARSLLIRGCQRPIRWLCCRELQNSIAESVHQLFKEQIEVLGMGNYFTVQRDGIYGKNGTEFFYAGLRNDPQKVKSTEGLDGAWVEEGQSISDESWMILDPTVRKAGSEILMTYNPRFEEDPVHKMFADPATRPPRTWYKTLNYMDNPWFSEVNRAQMEHMRVHNPLLYEHVWLGKCVANLSTALWTWDSIEKNRVPIGTALSPARVVVAVDPAVTANKDSDETGISVAGCSKGAPRHYYILADLSGRYTPEQWARKALQAYDTYEADAMVFEVNQGGDLVLDTIRNVCRADGRPVPRLVAVRATRGKVRRAEPVAALYSQNLVSHVGALPDLERQLLRFNPVPEENKGQKSPDRLDAMVWGVTHLSEGRAPMRIAAEAVKALTRFGQSRC